MKNNIETTDNFFENKEYGEFLIKNNNIKDKNEKFNLLKIFIEENKTLDLPKIDKILEDFSITDNEHKIELTKIKYDNEHKIELTKIKYDNEVKNLIHIITSDNQDKNLELINNFLKNNQTYLNEERMDSLKESLRTESKIKNFEDVNNLIDIHNLLNNKDKLNENNLNSFSKLIEKFKKEPAIINDDTKISLFKDFINKKNDKKVSPDDFSDLMSKLDIKDDNKKIKMTIDFIESDKCEEINLENLLRGILINDKSKSKDFPKTETISDVIDLIESKIEDYDYLFKNTKIIEKLIKNLPTIKNIQNDKEGDKLKQFIEKYHINAGNIDIISNFSNTGSTFSNQTKSDLVHAEPESASSRSEEPQSSPRESVSSFSCFSCLSTLFIKGRGNGSSRSR